MERDNKFRCFGNKEGQELYAAYHDNEWGKEVHNDFVLFEFLVLEGAQAGLNWYTILKKREGYRKVFYNFDPSLVAKMTDEELESLRQDKRIIRNKLKIYSVRNNALVFLKIQKEFKTFDNFLWSFVNYKQIVNHYRSLYDVPSSTVISDKLSKELKKRGMSFVGSKIMYAYMQAVGLVDDHLDSCYIKNLYN
ncbi:MAG: DNA-3-methyladenine glycosylase I [Candidatus Izimaplasma sp.]|nr:DNA-3-methyladenine glycosylase I [Candidatus Izimaplasma bacterium]